MRKNNTAIIFGSLFFSCSVMAANGTLAPTVVPMVNGGQASIAISNTSPNLFTVPGARMILETSDRFTVVQGYAGVGKTTQFRAVMSAVNMLPESERPRVVGLGPTHRAVGEMRSAGVDAQTLASFLHDTQMQQRSGETPDFSNTLFLLDESSMVG